MEQVKLGVPNTKYAVMAEHDPFTLLKLETEVWSRVYAGTMANIAELAKGNLPAGFSAAACADVAVQEWRKRVGL